MFVLKSICPFVWVAAIEGFIRPWYQCQSRDTSHQQSTRNPQPWKFPGIPKSVNSKSRRHYWWTFTWVPLILPHDRYHNNLKQQYDLPRKFEYMFDRVDRTYNNRWYIINSTFINDEWIHVIVFMFTVVSGRNYLPYVREHLMPGGRLNKKDGLTRYGDSHVKDKTS